MVKISIIIPCFNVEKYIAECLNSIVEQSLDEIELICIDDGSTDDTALVLRDYCERYENIKCLFIENKGSGNARNLGIRLAQGEYIAFMDADDFYPDKDILEILYLNAAERQADICGGSACYFRDGLYIYKGLRKGVTFIRDEWVCKEKFPDIFGYWRFIYNRSFINRHCIEFPDYLRCQDPPFFLNAVAKAGKAYCIKKITYCYRVQHKEVRYNNKKVLDYAKGIRDSLLIACENNLNTVFDVVEDELFGEFSALLYEFYMDMLKLQQVVNDINQILIKHSKKDNIKLLLEGEEVSQYLDQVAHERKMLIDKLNLFQYVVVFGAGNIGRKVMRFLRKNGIKQEAFVVSETNENINEIDGILVKNINDYTEKRDLCIVLVATLPRLHREIITILNDRGFKEYIIMNAEELCLFEKGRKV